MKNSKRARLVEHGWRVGSVAEFLNASQAEAAAMDAKLILRAPTPTWWMIAKDRRFWTGPTIPYLLAATRIARGHDVFASLDRYPSELRELLQSMRDDIPAPECIHLRWCPTLDALVAAPLRNPPAGIHSLQCPSDGTRALYYSLGQEITDFESLADRIWNDHAEPIMAGLMSREPVESSADHDWVVMTAPECDEVRMTLAHPEARTRW